MSPNSLFAILLRSPWWISFALAAAMGVTASTILPKDMATFGPFMGLPFVVTGCIALWRQLRAPRASRIVAIESHLAGLNWKECAALVEEAYRRGGYQVKRREGAADFTLEKDGRTTLVAAKRWKAASLGLEVLRDLDAAREAGGAAGAEVIAAGAVTDNARRFAEERGISVVSGPALARLFGFVSIKA
jgi:restriction system protein